uniref:Secreted protein n=1 Tax=Panagrellus redivivus TaxID=6233 RepID=A0A7E4VGS3_PANRE
MFLELFTFPSLMCLKLVSQACQPVMLINNISEAALFTSSLRYKLKKDHQNCQRRRQRYRMNSPRLIKNVMLPRYAVTSPLLVLLLKFVFCIVLF